MTKGTKGIMATHAEKQDTYQRRRKKSIKEPPSPPMSEKQDTYHEIPACHTPEILSNNLTSFSSFVEEKSPIYRLVTDSHFVPPFPNKTL